MWCTVFSMKLRTSNENERGQGKMAEVADFEAKKKQIIKKKKRARAKRRLIVFMFLFVCVGIIFTVLKAPVFNVKGIMCV